MIRHDTSSVTGRVLTARHFPGVQAALLAALIAATPAAAIADPFNFASADGNFTAKWGGRIMFDSDSYDGALNRDQGGNRRWDTQLRRTRLESSGTLFEHFEWVADLNFNDNPDAPKTEWHAAGIRYTGLSWFNVFLGRDKEPFGLEELQSSKAIASIERNYFTEATDADSQPHHGVRLDGHLGKVGWSAAWNSPVDRPQMANGDDRIAFTGRIFGAPLQSAEQTLHLGLGYTDRNLDFAVNQSGFRLDIAESGGQLDSSGLLTRQDRQTGLEFLYMQGPFTVQSEYFQKEMAAPVGDPDGQVDAWYLQTTWTVTGEARAYRVADGFPDTVKPTGKWGAVELVAKYDWIAFDADDRPTETARGYLAGVNWYVDKHIRLMLNYIHVDSDNLVGEDEDETADVISTRIQFAF